MTLELFLIFTVIFLVCVIFFLLVKLMSSDHKGNDAENFRYLFKELQGFTKVVDKKLSEINRGNLKQSEINTSISRDATQTLAGLTKQLSALEHTNKKIQDIGGQLEGLESILKNPKNRGILGEYFLESVLKNILPPENYSIQYKFKNGEKVDAAIFVDKKVIPIDSKFSLENYNKILDAETETEKKIAIKNFKSDFKKRIDETAKYIRPEESTMDFAFMFIPSEGIYYDILVNKIGNLHASTIDLIEYAFKEKKIIIVSPTSFYAYLQTVLQGLRAISIEEKAEEIKKYVVKMSKHLNDYEAYLQKLGNSLGATVNHYNTAYKKFNMLEKDVIKITKEDEHIETLELSKPE